MKNTFYLFLFVFHISLTAWSADCPCGSTGTSKHKRAEVKNRKKGNADEAMAMKPADLYDLKITKNELAWIKQNGDSILTQEKQIVKLTGYLRLLKISSDDCDIHMEIATTSDVNSYRIIAEIPNTQEYCSLRKEVLKMIDDKYDVFEKKEYKFGKGKLKTLSKISVYGYVFFDSAHVKKGGGSNKHGSQRVQTLWEVHPVFKVEWQ